MKTKPEIINFVRHCPCQSFSNKCDCARHVNSINAEVTATLLGSSIMAPQMFPCLSMFFIERSKVYPIRGSWMLRYLLQSKAHLLINELAISFSQQEIGPSAYQAQCFLCLRPLPYKSE